MQALEEQEIDAESAAGGPKRGNGLPSYPEAMRCTPGQAQPCDFNFYEYPVPAHPPPAYPGTSRATASQEHLEFPSVGKSLQKLMCGILCALLFVWLAVLLWIVIVHSISPRLDKNQM
ncbi:hypothetical protein QR680_016743 [Steinernema hermaphroditum]|uniref:Uncharacterized protein n=1 Tax=Steinernema hermaphroditum TaxID=289476 RepID=A0AA39LMU5_9BILA|nr:hypothetical protein QR680_016743 [Steinernema hermaphroditum]